MNEHWKNQISNYYLQSLTPVHVGSGVRLRKGLDFFSGAGRTWRVDPVALEKVLVEHPEVLNEFADGDELEIDALFAKHQIDPAQIVKTSYRGEVTVQDLYEFVRTGRGQPFLPGSSLKGAFRTVLLWESAQAGDWQTDHERLLQDALGARDARSAGYPFTEKAFHVAVQKKRSRESNFDLMRVLRIGDVHFSPGDLELADTRIFNLDSEQSGSWKDLVKRRNVNSAREATQLAAEALRVGAAGPVSIQLDNFLLNSPAVARTARFDRQEGLFRNLAEVCNRYAARQIAQQLVFAETFQLDALRSFYRGLQQILEQLPEGDFLLRLSWGSGWQGMTGELIEEADELMRIRKKYNLGKYRWEGDMPERCPICGAANIRPDNRRDGFGFCLQGKHSFKISGMRKIFFPVFPKTRKVVLVDQQPRYPLGWVCFSSAAPEVPPAEDRSQFRPPQRKAPPQKPTTKAPPLTEFKPIQREAAGKIRRGDKIRAEVLKVEGKQVQIRLLQKDEGRELSFKEVYLPPMKPGDTVLVTVEKTNPEGNEVTAVKFRYVVNN